MSARLHQPAVTSTPEFASARSVQQLADFARRMLGCEATVVRLTCADRSPQGQRGTCAASFRRDFQAAGGPAIDPAALAHPLAAAGQGMRFYAGLPLHDRAGKPIGMLAAMDHEERALGSGELEELKRIAAMAADIPMRERLLAEG